MSLNKVEQQLHEYLLKAPEERQYWEQKVRAVAASQSDNFTAAVVLDLALRAYLAERSQFVTQLSDISGTISMRHLAEYLLRMWTTPRPKIKTPDTNTEFGAGVGN